MPGPNRMPFSAAPDKDGNLWIPDMVPPTTSDGSIPRPVKFRIHRAQSISRGHSFRDSRAGWVRVDCRAGREQSGPLGSEYQAHHGISGHHAKGLEGLEDGGSKHTVRVDSSGRVWGTSVHAELTVYDPKNNEFSHFADTYSPYGVETDKAGNPWFAELMRRGKLGWWTRKRAR